MKALITGIDGQDGHYLAQYLLSKNYRVFGMSRRHAPHKSQVEYVYGDLRDEVSLNAAIRKAWPDEIYNLAGQSAVPVSWEKPAETFDVNTGGLARILKVVELYKRDTKVYQASSSEMFGNFNGSCNESTRLMPMSPYGVSKAASHRLVSLYRDRGLYVVAGILFNHESPRRGLEMVTRKIACHVAQWAAGSKEILYLGNVESRRDWGFSGDYVEAMHSMLQLPHAEDFVIGTGVSYSVEQFLMASCQYAGVDWGFATDHMSTDKRMARTQEIFDLKADAAKARTILQWEPTVDFETLVGMMTKSEMERVAVPYESVT